MNRCERASHTVRSTRDTSAECRSAGRRLNRLSMIGVLLGSALMLNQIHSPAAGAFATGRAISSPTRARLQVNSS